ncbi:cation-translocating P-type ATPase [Vulcanococcus limneticus]|uniref:cation-translocating P-type ATPase n=1 Tax=Vulcanococcus limneticus TaxID=2170428 RepID=UPI00398BEB34
MSDPAPPSWHALAPQACLDALAAAPLGLTSEQAARRLALSGPNRLEPERGRGRWRILLDQFGNVMLLLLLAVAGVAAWLDLSAQRLPRDTIAIGLIVVLNAALGYLQESRAERALLALRQLAQPQVPVCRDGQWQVLAAEQLVPGDLIRLAAGDRVAADARLLEGSELGVREASLTGESDTVDKRAELVLPSGTPVAERRNCVFQGTEVVRGQGLALVTATGLATELGRIALLLRRTPRERSPLQRRLDQLSQQLVGGALVLVGAAMLVGAWRGQPLLELLEMALAAAVAVVPEGLPAVITVTLALGTQRMVRRHALIRRLPAVETLGSVTVICTDKTGTLTENRQVVQTLRVGTVSLGWGSASRLAPDPAVPGQLTPGSRTREVPGHPADPEPLRREVLPPPAGARPGSTPGALSLLLSAGVLCNDARWSAAVIAGSPAAGGKQATGEPTACAGPTLEGSTLAGRTLLGDPTEGALLLAAERAGLDAEAIRRRHPRSAELAFSAERQWMAVAVLDGDGALQAGLADPAAGRDSLAAAGQLAIAKGAPEVLLAHCNRWLDGAGVAPLDDLQRRWWLEQAQGLAASGQRVLALACGSPRALAQFDASADWILLGLVGQRDPARPEVPEALARCRSAGIRVVMITGDHPLTARSIGAGIGLADPQSPVLLGQELELLSDAELAVAVAGCDIYARVPPEQKLRIVQALQAGGAIVAMTGDGINDSPALRQAHIGVAMGQQGTEVCKEAADMVLLDDDFATIVSAVEEGRRVLVTIRRFVTYVLASNIGELVAISAAPLLGVPLTPLQILWINLVTDGVPALALALGPVDQELMQRPPLPAREPIFAQGTGAAILRIGLVFAALTLGLMLVAARSGAPWPTMVFTTLCMAQLGHALSAGSERPLLATSPLRNPWLLGSVLLSAAAQLALLQVPALARFFQLTPLTATNLAICLGCSGLFVAYLEAEKAVRLWRRTQTIQTPTIQLDPDQTLPAQSAQCGSR